MTNAERGMTTTVNDIDHIESQSLVGVGIIKIYFHPNVNIGQAVAQVTAISQVQLRSLPPGTNSALHHPVQRFQRARVAIGALRAGPRRTQLNDLATNTIRLQLATVEGAQTPFPTVASSDRSWSISISTPSGTRTLARRRRHRPRCAKVIAPSGTIKLDRFEYQVETNSAPSRSR